MEVPQFRADIKFWRLSTNIEIIVSNPAQVPDPKGERELLRVTAAHHSSPWILLTDRLSCPRTHFGVASGRVIIPNCMGQK